MPIQFAKLQMETTKPAHKQNCEVEIQQTKTSESLLDNRNAV